MTKQIIKINTDPELTIVNIGDIVQFDDLDPAKAIKFVDCYDCCLRKDCSITSKTSFCSYINGENIMFKAIKTKV